MLAKALELPACGGEPIDEAAFLREIDLDLDEIDADRSPTAMVRLTPTYVGWLATAESDSSNWLSRRLVGDSLNDRKGNHPESNRSHRSRNRRDLIHPIPNIRVFDDGVTSLIVVRSIQNDVVTWG